MLDDLRLDDFGAGRFRCEVDFDHAAAKRCRRRERFDGAVDPLRGRPGKVEIATKALDRVLLWNHYVIPQWTYQKLRTARWDRYARPQVMPKYGVSGFPTIWWRDAPRIAKSAK